MFTGKQRAMEKKIMKDVERKEKNIWKKIIKCNVFSIKKGLLENKENNPNELSRHSFNPARIG